MKFDAGKLLNLGLKLAPYVIGAITKVDHDTEVALARGETKPSNQEREDAAVNIVKTVTGVIETAYGHDIVNDPEVESIIRDLIQSFIKANNAIRDIVHRKFIATTDVAPADQ